MEFERLLFNIFNYQYYFLLIWQLYNLTTSGVHVETAIALSLLNRQSAASIKFISNGRKQIYYNMIFHKTRIWLQTKFKQSLISILK